MAYYSERDIHILNNIDIRAVLDKLNIRSLMSGKRYQCPNPCHEDRHPSMSVKNNRWRCFSCGAHGGVIDLVKTVFDIDFPSACEWLVDNFNVNVDYRSYGTRKKLYQVKRKKEVVKQSEEIDVETDTEILNAVVSISMDNLQEDARLFLFNERKFSETVISNMKIGYNDKHNILRDELVKRYGIKRLLDACILKYIYNDYKLIWKPNSILHPFFDYDGKIINIIGREISPLDSKNKFISIKNVRTIPYNLNLLKDMQPGDNLCIMEGLTDTLAALSAGWKAIGLHGCSQSLVDYVFILKDYNLIYFHDNDTAGLSSYEERRKELAQYLIPLREGYIDKKYKDFSDYYAKKYLFNR